MGRKYQSDRRWIPTFVVILIIFLFLFVASGKAQTVDSSGSVNIFTYSTANHADTTEAWYTWVKTHTDWQVTGRDWYIPHFVDEVDSADQLGLGQYENWNHYLLTGADYASISSCMSGKGEPLESLFVHFKWNTVQSWDEVHYMFPGWSASNDGNSDGINDYSGDWSREHAEIAHVGINSNAGGDDTLYIFNRSWTNDLYNGGVLVIGWTESWSVGQNDSACTTVVVDTYNDSVLLVDSIPDRGYYIFFYVSHVDMPEPYANAQADSQSRARTYTDYQFITNYRNTNWQACHSKYLCDEIRDRKNTQGYDGRLGIFYDNAWQDCKPSIMGRASWNRPQYPRQGATNFETIEGWWEDGSDVRAANYALIAMVFDSLDALPFPTSCGANMGNYFTAEYDSLMWQFKSQGSVWGAPFFERVFDNDAYHGGKWVGMRDQVYELRAEADMFILINYDSDLIGTDTARAQMFATCSHLLWQYDSVYMYFGYWGSWANAVKDWDAGAGIDCKWWIPLMKFNLGDTVTPSFSWTQGGEWKGYRRDFDSAIVLARPRPSQSSNYTDEVTVDFNDTFFYELNRFGERLSGDSADQFTIMNCEGVFLERAWGLADSLQQYITHWDTTTSSYVIRDSVKTDYNGTDSVTHWHGTNGDWDSLVRTDIFTGTDTGMLEVTGLLEGTKYYFRILAWDEENADTTLLDSIWTLSNDSIYQSVAYVETTATYFIVRDTIVSTYSETADSGVLKISTDNEIAHSIWKATFTSANAGNLQASNLNSSTKYYFWCLGWDSENSDTTDVDSITTKSATGEADSFNCNYTIIEDSYINQGDPTFNYGGTDALRAGRGSATSYRYMTFKVNNISDSLPSNANVDSACFRIYFIDDYSTLDAGEYISLVWYELKKAFGEGDNDGAPGDSSDVNWNSAQQGVEDWFTAGAKDTTYDRAGTKQSDGVHVDTVLIDSDTPEGTWFTFWLNTSTVEGWRDGDNLGIILVVSDESEDTNHQGRFASAEYGSNEPVFTCWYSSPESPRKFVLLKR